MAQKEPAARTNEELLQEAKKIRPTTIMDAVIVGFLIGVAIYATVKGGLGLLTFLPLVYLPIAARNKTKHRALEALLNERGLKKP